MDGWMDGWSKCCFEMVFLFTRGRERTTMEWRLELRLELRLRLRGTILTKSNQTNRLRYESPVGWIVGVCVWWAAVSKVLVMPVADFWVSKVVGNWCVCWDGCWRGVCALHANACVDVMCAHTHADLDHLGRY